MKKPAVSSILVVVVLLAVTVIAQAQQKMCRVGVLMLAGPDIPEIKGLRDGLKEAGYVEGNNLILDFPAKETPDELRPIAKVYIEKKFDVIVAMGATAALIASELTREIPIVFVGSSDPVGRTRSSSKEAPWQEKVEQVTKRIEAKS
jgi:putative tryptophan/tyrosine transport system substrate-binding protein